ncbi:MAG: hypothetical protein ACUVWW_01765 [Anaerolineae bacterium]
MKTANPSIESLALRLLRLEQRFQSYSALHDEELKEIHEALRRLREDLLAQASPDTEGFLSHSDEEGAGQEEEEDIPISAL